MGDRSSATLEVFHVDNPLETEAICAAIDELSDLGRAEDEVVLYDDYSFDEVSVGTVAGIAGILAKAAPRSAWHFTQFGYSVDLGEEFYHFPGLGLFGCESDGNGPLWTNDEVRKFCLLHPVERGMAMGEPWIQATYGFRAFLGHVPLEQRTIRRPTPDELEALRNTEREVSAT